MIIRPFFQSSLLSLNNSKTMKKNSKKINPIWIVIIVLVAAAFILKPILFESDGESNSDSGDLLNNILEELADLPEIAGNEEEVPETEPEEKEKEPTEESPEEIIGEPTEEPKENTAEQKEETPDIAYKVRTASQLKDHYEKHGIEMGFSSREEYEAAASDVVNNKNALHKIEKEDGDDVYYIEATNEFVIVSGDGYLRTYFLPSAGIDYYNRQ